ncbi:restriction endonuclease subunit S [Elizabethkingia anophelis]|uniref:restriction endonuclease subunit S n=1 Tax=Elizabethkingia anophelis TaxID=1117645 RepID=UPI00301C97A8
MKRYDKYKDSGVEWIGEIPEHWEMLSNKYIFKLTKSQVGKKSADFELLSLTLKGIIKRDMENPEGKFPAEFDTYQKVKKGDFVFCLFDVEETPRTVGLSDFNGMITGAYTVFTGSPKTNSKYLFYFYLNLDEKKRLKFLYRGLRNTIPKDSFFSFKTTFPPLPEQQTIASFLDEKTAKIEQTISIKEKEIELLKERRQILIQKAVTKGLDDSVKFKDSGVEWIGEIPEHWEMKKLKYVVNMQSGETITAESFTDEGYPVMGGNGFRGFTNKYTNEGDFILIGRQGALCGNVNYAQGKFFATEHAIVVYPNKDVLNILWLGELIRLADLNKLSQTAAQPGISVSQIKNVTTPFIPIDEQQSIVIYLEKIEEKISKAISLKQQEIEKLKEYKTVLIDNVVTGKVKVY